MVISNAPLIRDLHLHSHLISRYRVLSRKYHGKTLPISTGVFFFHPDQEKPRSPTMKSFAIFFALLHLASLCYGAPGSLSNPLLKPRQLFIIALTTFNGPGPDAAHYFGAFTTMGAVQTISKPSILLQRALKSFRSCGQLYTPQSLPSSSYLVVKRAWLLIMLTGNPLSVSNISITEDSTGVTCTFFGIDGSQTVVSFGETVDVGPPQAQVSAVCTTTA